MTAQELASKVAGTFEDVSPSALRLIHLLRDPDAASEEVVHVLKHDAALTAKLLRACNAPSLGLVEPVSSVEQAVVLLGYEQIFRMVLSLAFSNALGQPMPGYAVAANELWRHSLFVGVAAELVSTHLPQFNVDASTAFTAGLLHDIGKIAMNQALSPEVQASIRYQIAEHATSRVAAEHQCVGTDHAEVGACLLSLWNLPDSLVEGVAYHHAPLLEPPGLVSPVVYVANYLAHLAGSAPGWEAYAVKIQDQITTVYSLTANTLQQLLIQLRDEAGRAESFIVS